MTVDAALEKFSAFPQYDEQAQAAPGSGLGYVISTAGNTLSGGEAQRVKLAKELSRRATGRPCTCWMKPSVGLARCGCTQADRSVAAPGGCRQFGPDHRAQPGDHQGVGLDHRPLGPRAAIGVVELGPDPEADRGLSPVLHRRVP